MIKKKLVAKNIIYSSITRLIILVIGIIIPRLLITSFGSEVNGLLSTVTQIFTYLALVEAGIGNSAINALYKPLGEKDFREANEVAGEARDYYRRVSVVYGIAIIVFSVVYPFLAKTNLSKSLVFWVIILQGAANFIGYYYTAVYTQLLTADGKGYINQNISFFTYLLSSIIKIVLILLGYNVIAVQIGYFIVSIVKVPIVMGLCRKKYPWLDFKVEKYNNRLKERSAFIVHEISSTIFNNTDVFLISTFCSFSMASVYYVYNLVYSSLTTLLTTASSGLGFVIGQNKDKGVKQLSRIYDVYTMFYDWMVYTLFTVSFILIIPFVKLYTAGVTDIDYLISGLPLLFSIISLLSGVRASGALLITVSGHAERTKNRSILEATINLGSSLILVNLMGIKGVLLGTIIALVYRTNDIIIYANTKILKRSPIKEYFGIVVNTCIFVVFFFVSKKFTISSESYMYFFVQALVVFCFVAICYFIVALLLNPAVVRTICQWFKKKNKSKGSV